MSAKRQGTACSENSGKWNFPGGSIEPGETPHSAAASELREETSIEGHGLLSLCSIRVGSSCITSSPPDSTKLRSLWPTMK
ncbi:MULTISPECIES: NUDIX domain-containing protein [unclassified Pseudomonas]|uniref:NUDIX domain-containing protein n=1 Tax=unclassified Pseudomonas TaxID=196821 RepID=UPI002115B77E|nr:MULTISPECIES: NUDIX domain-containing protein [unclassified Pseudomonas]